MYVAAVARPEEREQLYKWFPGVEFEFPQPADLELCLRTSPVYATLISGSAVASPDVEDIASVAQFQRHPLILCGRITPPFSQLVSYLGGMTNPHVQIRDFDDAGTAIDFVSQQSPLREQRQLLRLLQPSLDKLPGKLKLALIWAMQRLPVERNVALLAAHANMTERSVSNHLSAAGLAGAATIIRSPRLVDAWAFSLDPEFRLRDIAQKCGYERGEGLRRVLRRCGFADREHLASLSGPAIVERIMAIAHSV